MIVALFLYYKSLKPSRLTDIATRHSDPSSQNPNESFSFLPFQDLFPPVSGKER